MTHSVCQVCRYVRKMLILIGRWGGTPGRYQLVNIVEAENFPREICGRRCERAGTLKAKSCGCSRVQKFRADETCFIGVAAAWQLVHSVLSLRSIHSTACEGAMAQR